MLDKPFNSSLSDEHERRVVFTPTAEPSKSSLGPSAFSFTYSTSQKIEGRLVGLSELRGKYQASCPSKRIMVSILCALKAHVLDCHAAHGSPKIRDHAAILGIRLWFIPAGHTNELQPFDRALFGP
jgi:hypothetical protein